MERRKFVKYSGLAGLAVGFFPVQSFASINGNRSSILVDLPLAQTQIRHGALNLPFASSIKKEMPFQWILDIHQNIFLQDGFQRNLDGDLDITSIALEVEDGFEALQIAKQNDKVHLVWKENSFEISLKKNFQRLNLGDNIYTFYLGHLTNDESAPFDLFTSQEYFIQVLAGSLCYDDLTLTKETGLGICNLCNLASFNKREEDVCFLMIGR